MLCGSSSHSVSDRFLTTPLPACRVVVGNTSLVVESTRLVGTATYKIIQEYIFSSALVTLLLYIYIYIYIYRIYSEELTTFCRKQFSEESFFLLRFYSDDF